MPAPTITSVSMGGLLDGVVRINGTSFAGATAVAFGSTAAISFSVRSDTTILASPASRPISGALVVTVTTPGGSFTAAVVVDDFAPPAPPPGVSVDAAGYLGAVSSQSAMTALEASGGDFCYRTDLGELLFLIFPPGTVADNWVASGTSTGGGVDGGTASSIYGGLVFDGGSA